MKASSSAFVFRVGCVCCPPSPPSSSSLSPHYQPLLVVPNNADASSTYSNKRLRRRLTDGIPRVLDSRPSLLAGGAYAASQVNEVLPATAACPQVVVREARVQDCWDIADTHCSSFFPNYSFPFDLMLRMNRSLALFSTLSLPIENNDMRKCLVAVVGSRPVRESQLFGSMEDFKFFRVEENFGFNREYIAGILTIDILAEFLPRKGPLGKRRTGIGYISNVAVKQTERRKGIAKKLMIKADEQARRWGCRSLALHCDASNPAAVALYKSQGFRCIKIPVGANWPEPRTAPGTRFHFMLKLLSA